MVEYLSHCFHFWTLYKDGLKRIFYVSINNNSWTSWHSVECITSPRHIGTVSLPASIDLDFPHCAVTNFPSFTLAHQSTIELPITAILTITLTHNPNLNLILKNILCSTFYLFPTVGFLALKSGGGFGANINVGAKTPRVCKEHFYCS